MLDRVSLRMVQNSGDRWDMAIDERPLWGCESRDRTVDMTAGGSDVGPGLKFWTGFGWGAAREPKRAGWGTAFASAAAATVLLARMAVGKVWNSFFDARLPTNDIIIVQIKGIACVRGSDDGFAKLRNVRETQPE